MLVESQLLWNIGKRLKYFWRLWQRLNIIWIGLLLLGDVDGDILFVDVDGNSLIYYLQEIA